METEADADEWRDAASCVSANSACVRLYQQRRVVRDVCVCVSSGATAVPEFICMYRDTYYATL